MNEANTLGGANTINLDPGSYTLTSADNVVSQVRLPIVTSELTINGVDAGTTIIEGPAGIFSVAPGGNLTLNGLTVRGGTTRYTEQRHIKSQLQYH